MLESAEKALQLVKGKKQTEFLQDEILQLALSRLVEIIGEAASRVTKVTRDRQQKIPWRDIIATRHRMVHDYYLVNVEVLWEIVKHDLRPLVNNLKQILQPKLKRRPSPKPGS
ncbi:MAG TPA: HepT-like ribonuclease domain-containing protein [Gemmataceae bacterium]|nr:HepT-like ribonuclease domain-containing protein [Gemmataceae bacterium]